MTPDILVVGAGSAGCVLAARLSEDPRRRVLLVEAGPDTLGDATEPEVAGPDFFAARDVPGRWWTGLTALRSTAGPQPYPRGRGTGGTSAVNAMLALRGIPADYDRWESMGAAGWGWDRVGPAFDRLAAWLPLATVPEPWPVLDGCLQQAAAALGHPWAPDANEPGAEGMSPAQLTWGEGRRSSAAGAYLEPARERANLAVMGDAQVDRVLLDGRRAVGVRLADGRELAAGEVVLSCGAIHSPAVLLRSGIDRRGVGRNLKDHPSAVATLQLRPDAAGKPGSFPFATVLRWSSGREAADLQLVPLSHLGLGAEAGLGAVLVALMQVRSSGTVTVESDDPHDHPLVDLRLLTEDHDLERLARGLRHAVRLLQHPAVTAVTSSVTMGADGTAADALLEPGAAEAWLPRNPGDYFHASGTCRMGDGADPDSVCDSLGRVHGYERLRVVDASIFPDLPRANPHLGVVMVAERISAAWTGGQPD